MNVVGTAGHVDHGKSALVKALTGIDPDRFEEEKRRGLTIDLGFAWCTLPSGREIGIVDVPGHERFIRNMLAGVGSIDTAIFVVAADEGWKPQSEEHLQILEILGLGSGVVALAKADLVSADDLELTREMVWQRLRDTVLADAEIIAVSAATGSGLDELRAALDRVLDGAPDARDTGRPRMFIDRSFTIAGAGTVVTGTLAGGSLRVGDEIEIAPDGHRARIRTLQTHKRTVDEASPGSRVAANLVGLERTEIARGDAVVLPRQWVVTTTFAGRLTTLPTLAHEVAERGSYLLYIGSAELACRLKFLEEGTETGPLVQVFFDRPLPLGVGDRFVVRDAGRGETVGGGVVLDQAPGNIRRKETGSLERLRAREGLTGPDLMAQIVAERGVVRASEAAVLAGAPPDAHTPSFLVSAERAEALAAKASTLVEEHHRRRPLDEGIPREELRAALDISSGAFDELVPTWPGLESRGNVVRSSERPVDIDPQVRSDADRLLERLREAGISPPGVKELDASIDLLKLLERRGELVFVSPAIAYEGGVWRGVEVRIAQTIFQEGPITVSRARDVLGATRKYAVPLLEKLDATGVTRRLGDVRELGPRGRELVS